ncbi:MAG TPA: glycine betaine ABC transporter substrate-binding protein [Candidatus Limnocylindrales bacterium]|nr:glycine betaine ABC transporter substrate-binding protein [Candidatus Limnocylindrales bacterium]
MSRTLALGASMLVLASACSTGGGSKPTIKIGSDGFDEARVVAEVYAQVLEANGYTVDRAGIGLGARKVTAAALESGQIDLKPEYIGSGLVYYEGTASNDPAKNKTDLQAKLTSVGGGITVFGYTPGQDTNALVVTKATADAKSLAKWSDLTAVATDLKWGLATDCPTNPVCAQALKDSYGIDTSKLNVTLLDACSTPMADALKAGTIDVAELCSTGPEIIVNNWVRLDDDKKTQPADAIAPIVRNDLLAKVGDKAAFQKLLDDVSAKIDTVTLADLYKQVAVDKKDTKDVASTWLKAQGLIK